ncbi:MAG: hypothetical protein ABW006_08780 [Hyphomicrobium sp.]
MDERECVARRVAAVCAELRDEATRVGLDALAAILRLAILEATNNQSPPTAPAE